MVWNTSRTLNTYLLMWRELVGICRERIWQLPERDKNGPVCLLLSRTVVACIKGQQCVELALVRQPYRVQSSTWALHILPDKSHWVHSSCRPHVLNLAKVHQVSSGAWRKQRYDNLEGSSPNARALKMFDISNGAGQIAVGVDFIIKGWGEILQQENKNNNR